MKWAAPAAGGKVLQVVYAGYSTDTSNATSTYADTGLTATITPSSASSKVLVLVNQAGVGKTSSDTHCDIRILRGATDLIMIGGLVGGTSSSANNFIGSVSGSYLDTPSTTSATTYKTQFRSRNNTSQASVQAASEGTSTMVLLEIGA